MKRANVKRDKELVRLCKLADYADTLKIGQYLQTRPARKQLGNALHTLRRSWQTNRFHRWAFTLKNHSRNENWADRRNMSSTQKDARELTWKCQARRTLRCWCGSARAQTKSKLSTHCGILKDIPNNETSESTGQPDVLRCHIECKGRPWAGTPATSETNLVFCSMLTRSSSYCGVRFCQKGSPVDKKRWKTWKWCSIIMERILQNCQNSEPEHDPRTASTSDSWKAHQPNKDMLERRIKVTRSKVISEDS